jgi:hypothetical protein
MWRIGAVGGRNLNSASSENALNLSLGVWLLGYPLSLERISPLHEFSPLLAQRQQLNAAAGTMELL